MSEAEILENYWNSQEVGIAMLSVFISVFSAYLLVAYLAGAKLSKSQAIFISIAFTIFSLMCTWGTVVYFGEGYDAALLLVDNHPSLLSFNVNPVWISLPLLLAAVVSALMFMWDIRHPKN